MGRSIAAQPRYHDAVTMPVPGHLGGVRVVMTPDGPLQSLIDYFGFVGARSASWQRKAAAAVGLLYDYHAAAPPQTPVEREQFFARFASALRYGTIGVDGTDSLDLYWNPGSLAKVREVVSIVTAFSDWCATRFGVAPLNPQRPATFPERLAAFRAKDHRNTRSLLQHLTKRREEWARAASVPTVQAPPEHKVVTRRPPFFPFEHTDDLLTRGFARAETGALWERQNVRDLMIVVLQRFGALRSCEPFHLFVQDVSPVIDAQTGDVTARVSLYHPHDGSVRYRDPLTGQTVLTDRATYLRAVYGRVHRNDPRCAPGERAGWKDLLLDVDKPHFCAHVRWFPEEWGAVFWRLYDAYTRHVLPAGLDHPYLFVNLRGDEGRYGAPYRVESYRDCLARAVHRVGLKSAKELGTTTHGLRHAYGQVLSKLKVPAKVIQQFMHHKSILSQAPYTQPEEKDVQRELNRAEARLRASEDETAALRSGVLPALVAGALA